MSRAVGYARVSTEKQAKGGLSLEAQSDKLHAMMVVRGDEMVELIVDDESAKTLKRPGLQRIIKMVIGGEIDAVVICKLDRLTRSVRDLAELLDLFNEYGVALVSLSESLDTQSASGKLVMNIMTAVSQWEREAISERTIAVMNLKKRRGERLGNIPYGFRDDGDGRVIQDEAEQFIIERIKDLRIEKKLSYRAAAEWMNDAGYRTRRGTMWRGEYVEDIIKAKDRGYVLDGQEVRV
jgi:DNA invertase Pin-like site-specific DNA recombinase